MVQKRVLKSIFPGKCYNDILYHTGISSLKERRDHLCRKYFSDMKVNSHKLNHLLPEKRQVEYDLRPWLMRIHCHRHGPMGIGIL